MTRSTIQRIATLGLAAVAVTAIGSTVSSASDEATTCQTWRPRIIVSDRSPHTWNPDHTIDVQYPDTWNPDDTIDDRSPDTWNPDDTIDGRYQHTWNPDDTIDSRYQHTLNAAGDPSDACPSPSGTTP